MKRAVLASILLISLLLPAAAADKVYNIGDTIEVSGTISSLDPGFFQIRTNYIALQLDPAIRQGSIGLPMIKKGKCHYSVGYKGLLLPDYQVEKFKEKYDLAAFEGRNVNLKAKIVLCDECHRQCQACNICCVFYLEPIEIKIIE